MNTPIGSDPDGIFANCVLAGCVAVIPYMALEEFFVTSYWVVFLWCLFVVIGTECQLDTDLARESS